MPAMNSLQDLQNNHHHHHRQQQHSQISSNPPQIQSQAPHFDPSSSHDDFLEHMFSTLPSCTWPDLSSDEARTTNQSSQENGGAFHFDESAILASKLRNHQISSGSSVAAAAAAKMMLQQQLLLSRGGEGESGLLPMPLSLGGGDFDRTQNDVVDQGETNSVQALFNGFGGSLHSSNQPQHFQHLQAQNYGTQGTAMNQAPAASGSTGGAPAQTRQKVRARRGQATDPHSIAERLRRERIAERMKALQELVPNANKTDKASMLDEIIDYVKFLQLQVKVLSMSRLGGASAVAPLVADMSSEGGGGDCIQANTTGAAGTHPSSSNDSLSVTEHQVAKLMEEDMGSAMQYLQGKGLCLMPISLATAISTATCQSRNPMLAALNGHPILQSNGDGPSSPSMSVLTVQSATMGNGVDCSVKDANSVSKP